MKKILSAILVVATVLMMTSCEEYLDVNTNVDAPDHVDAGLLLPGCLSALQGVYWDTRATAPLSQMFYGVYPNYGNHFYNKASDAAGEMWRTNYWLLGMNLENMIHQAEEDEAWTLAGIGYAIKAFSWDATTKLNGDMPCLQAYEPGRLNFDYDSQEIVYGKIREWAEQAIDYLSREDTFAYGSYLTAGDLIYKGDKTKWLKFAHGVIVRNLASLTNKKDFTSKYANDLLTHAQAALQSNADVARMFREGGGADAQFSAYNNWWGVYRGNLDGCYQSDYAVQVMTGTVPKYDDNGNKIPADPAEGEDTPDPYYSYVYADQQIICDNSMAPGHFDPRHVVKLGSTDARFYNDMDNVEAIKGWRYYGGSVGSTAAQNSAEGTVANMWGCRTAGYASTPSVDGQGRWLYRNDAYYIFMTPAEMKFDMAETYWKMGDKAAALAAWKEAVCLDVDFTVIDLYPGAPKADGKDDDGNDKFADYGNLPGGDVITAATYNKLAQEYKDGPYVNGMTLADFTLSHIMMQKWVSYFPYGSNEAWVDLRKYMYDIKYTGEYPTDGNGWNKTSLDSKRDEDPTKVYKGFYLNPSNVQGRRSAFNVENYGSPCFRLRPRYNSEYMWNKDGLDAIKPIGGRALNYHCSIPWFAYPGDMPAELPAYYND